MKNNVQAVHAEPSIDDQQIYWDERWDKTQSPNDWSVRRGQTILSFIKSLRLKQPNMLDIGCGTGWFTSELSNIGQTTGIDLSERAIEIAKSSYPGVNFSTGDLYTHDFPATSFDVVVAQEVIPHVEDQPKFVSIINTLLKPGGLLAITMVNKVAMDRAEWDHGPSSHIINWLTLKELRSLLGQNFRVLKTTTIIPIGNKGFLRIVNSRKLNTILRYVFSEAAINSAKERMGLGYTRIVFFRKKNEDDSGRR